MSVIFFISALSDFSIENVDTLVVKFYSNWWVVPSLTEDGRWILFNGSFNKKKNDYIYGYDLRKKKLRKIIETNYNVESPFYNIQSSSIVFSGYYNIDDNYELYRYSFKEKQISKLTKSQWNESCPSFNETGDYIVCFAGKNKKFFLRILGKEKREIVYKTKAMYPSFDWSGKNIIFAYQSYNEKDNGLAVYSIKTGRIKRLITNHRTFIYSPSFSPDGRYVAFVDDGDDNIYIYDKRSRRYKRITEKGDYSFVRWSNGGKYLISTEFKEKGDKYIFVLVKINLNTGSYNFKTAAKKYDVDFTDYKLPVRLDLSEVKIDRRILVYLFRNTYIKYILIFVLAGLIMFFYSIVNRR